MYFRNSAIIGLSFTAVFSVNIIAKEIAIYRWLDENNVVHYSQQPPQGGNYTQLTTTSSFQSKEKQPLESVNKATVDEQISQYEKDKAEVLAKNAEITKKNCQAAKLNEQMLNSFDNVMITDANGKNSVMSDKDKKEQIALNKKQISMYCGKDNKK
tara:strand:- start:10 stop:477 length:468 start_codon:yes stop_codon:yes gene_type:complete